MIEAAALVFATTNYALPCPARDTARLARAQRAVLAALGPAFD